LKNNIDNKTKGAWIIHHAGKLQTVVNVSPFENLNIAGKAGMLLSALSTTNQITITHEKATILAQEANISSLELKGLVNILKKHELIDINNFGIELLGLTTSATLEHTAKIFDNQNPKTTEIASIFLSEKISEAPYKKKEILSEISDLYRIDKFNLKDFGKNIENMGIVDIEKVDDTNTLYFNGNLFNRKDANKIYQVISTLTHEEQRQLNDFNNFLDEMACIEKAAALKIISEKLFSKISSIGMLDVNVLSNEQGEVAFITKPSSFSKYSTSNIDDAFDLAKAFVSSLTFGMTKSHYKRGRIQMIDKLLQALIRGQTVGPVDAIGQDYKILELKHVVEIKRGEKVNFYGNRCSGWIMKLLKKDVGELALQAISKGNISEQSLELLPSAVVNKYKNPEITRTITRKKLNERSPKATNDMIMALRTGRGI